MPSLNSVPPNVYLKRMYQNAMCEKRTYFLCLNFLLFAGEAVFPKEEFQFYVSKCKAKAQELENKFLEIAKAHQASLQKHIFEYLKKNR